MRLGTVWHILKYCSARRMSNSVCRTGPGVAGSRIAAKGGMRASSRFALLLVVVLVLSSLALGECWHSRSTQQPHPVESVSPSESRLHALLQWVEQVSDEQK